MSELARQVFGLPIPDEGALFDVALALHILAGLTCVITGALAATAPKRPGRHTRSGVIFLWALAVVFASSTTMAGLRFAQDWHLLVIGTVLLIRNMNSRLKRLPERFQYEDQNRPADPPEGPRDAIRVHARRPVAREEDHLVHHQDHPHVAPLEPDLLGEGGKVDHVDDPREGEEELEEG